MDFFWKNAKCRGFIGQDLLHYNDVKKRLRWEHLSPWMMMTLSEWDFFTWNDCRHLRWRGQRRGQRCRRGRRDQPVLRRWRRDGTPDEMELTVWKNGHSDLLLLLFHCVQITFPCRPSFVSIFPSLWSSFFAFVQALPIQKMILKIKLTKWILLYPCLFNIIFLSFCFHSIV